MVVGMDMTLVMRIEEVNKWLNLCDRCNVSKQIGCDYMLQDKFLKSPSILILSKKFWSSRIFKGFVASARILADSLADCTTLNETIAEIIIASHHTPM